MTGVRLYDVWIETVVLMFIILLFSTTTPGGIYYALFYGAFIVTLVQLIHSLTMASTYVTNKRMGRWLRYYWKGLLASAFFFFVFLVIVNSYKDGEWDSPTKTFFSWMVLGFPFVPSIYLWFLTIYFRSFGKSK